MTDRGHATRERPIDAAAVVEGQVGRPPIDVETGQSRDGRSIDGSVPTERQDRDPVGVDWDLTQRGRS
jgi:hypothetical protein